MIPIGTHRGMAFWTIFGPGTENDMHSDGVLRLILRLGGVGAEGERWIYPDRPPVIVCMQINNRDNRFAKSEREKDISFTLLK